MDKDDAPQFTAEEQAYLDSQKKALEELDREDELEKARQKLEQLKVAEAARVENNAVMKEHARDWANRFERGRRCSSVDLDQVNKQLLNVLKRDALRLLESSYREPLDRDQSQALIHYLKLIKDLKKQEAEEVDTISDEQLEKIANGDRSSKG